MEQLPASWMSRWKWLVAGAIVIFAAWWSYRWVYPSYQPPVQPVANGYQELLKLSGKLSRRTGWYNQMSAEELTGVVAANEPVLGQVRRTLRKDCVVALDWQADRQWFDNVHLKNASAMKELARAFAAEGLVGIKHGDARQTINSGLENLYLSKAVAHGGLGTDWLMGIATYTMGLMTLRDACDIATAEDCRFVLQNLPDVRELVEPPAAITEREWHFFRRINGAWSTFLTEMTFANNRADFEKRMESSLQVLQARADLVELHYQIRAFKLKEARPPRTLLEISEREGFVYQRSGDSYLLYSFGPNGVDDGGFENPTDPSKGDIQLKTTAESARDAAAN
jgi:hypothetical protein